MHLFSQARALRQLQIAHGQHAWGYLHQSTASDVTHVEYKSLMGNSGNFMKMRDISFLLVSIMNQIPLSTFRKLWFTTSPKKNVDPQYSNKVKEFGKSMKIMTRKSRHYSARSKYYNLASKLHDLASTCHDLAPNYYDLASK